MRRGDSARGLGPVYQHARVCIESTLDGGRQAAAACIQLDGVGARGQVSKWYTVGSRVMLLRSKVYDLRMVR
jgi:hypothetical protein